MEAQFLYLSFKSFIPRGTSKYCHISVHLGICVDGCLQRLSVYIDIVVVITVDLFLGYCDFVPTVRKKVLDSVEITVTTDGCCDHELLFDLMVERSQYMLTEGSSTATTGCKLDNISPFFTILVGVELERYFVFVREMGKDTDTLLSYDLCSPFDEFHFNPVCCYKSHNEQKQSPSKQPSP